MMDERKALSDLIHRLQEMESIAIGFSGGVDSSVLSVAATQALGREKVIAVLVDSPSLARREKADAIQFAEKQGLHWVVVQGQEFENPAYMRNDLNRCFHCKSDLAQQLKTIQVRFQLRHLAYGENADDSREFRPGIQAARENGIRAPLAELGLTKAVVRDMAKLLDLDVWDKPGSPCLSSRIPHGQPVTETALQRIDLGEAILAKYGFREFRVRHESAGARVELDLQEWAEKGNPSLWEQMERELLEIGFQKAWFDPKGLQSGGLSQRALSSQ
jgi:pyridinium-3,5-biscarboxylic acid mononucleotide sulfurtransferase